MYIRLLRGCFEVNNPICKAFLGSISEVILSLLTLRNAFFDFL